MANRGVGFFDSKGQFYRTANEATLSDLAGLLGRMGDGDSLAPGIAKILFDKRRELEHIFRDHDDMIQGRATDTRDRAEDVEVSNVTPIAPVRSA